MHEAYWGFTEAPFALTPDPKFYFLGHANEDVLMMLHYAVTRNKGVALLTGPLGTGKTALCHKLVQLLEPTKITAVTLVNPVLTPVQLHLEILAELGIKVRFKDRQAVPQELHQRLLAFYERGERVVLFIDDAHLIETSSTFEELRHLLNLQVDDQFLISVIMVGQSGLAMKVANVPELDQMIAVRERLQPMNLVDAGEMIMHRMRVAGFTGEPGTFSAEAVMAIYKFSKGVPRVICHLADHALMLAKNQKTKIIDGILLHQVIEEFYGVDNAA